MFLIIKEENDMFSTFEKLWESSEFVDRLCSGELGEEVACKTIDLQGKPPIDHLPKTLIVNGNMYMRGVAVKEMPETLIVYGCLDMAKATVGKMPKTLIVGLHMIAHLAHIDSLPEGTIVGSNLLLHMAHVGKIPRRLFVGNNANMCMVSPIRLPEEMACGGNILLPTWKNARPKIHDTIRAGYGIFRGGKYARFGNMADGEFLEPQDGRPGYLYADRTLVPIKRTKKFVLDGTEYTYYIGAIPCHNVLYDGEFYAHCENIRTGFEDIRFKRTISRGQEQYKGLSLDTEMSVPDLMAMYHIITGACQRGMKAFVERTAPTKERYTIREVIDMTKGEYGAETFREFFAA